MSSGTADHPNGPSRIAHGSIVVLAYLHDTDANCAEVARETGLSRSAVYDRLIDLEAGGILTAEPVQRDEGRPVLVYHLDDKALGAAAKVLVDRLTPTDTED